MVAATAQTLSTASARQVREDLAACYHIFAMFGWDDLTYTHISARVPGEDAYYIYPFGYLFEEVTASSLLRVSLDGVVLEGREAQYNATGYVIHGGIYQHRPDVNAIIHLHTPDGVSVSAMPQGLLPISQFSYHFYNRIGTHSYDSLALDEDRHGAGLVKDLGNNNALLLQNHGTLTCGRDMPEAFLYMYFLEKACQVQCRAGSDLTSLHVPPAEVCEQAARDMRAFEPDFGHRDWQALLRKLKRNNSCYAQ